MSSLEISKKIEKPLKKSTIGNKKRLALRDCR